MREPPEKAIPGGGQLPVLEELLQPSGTSRHAKPGKSEKGLSLGGDSSHPGKSKVNSRYAMSGSITENGMIGDRREVYGTINLRKSPP